MGLFVIKNPVEYSFHQWISAHPDSRHWADKERFYRFVKTVCRYNAKRWKDTNHVKTKILNKCPYFDKDYLEYLLRLYGKLIEFYKVLPTASGFQITDGHVKDAHYIEIQMKKGQIITKEVPIKRHITNTLCDIQK